MPLNRTHGCSGAHSGTSDDRPRRIRAAHRQNLEAQAHGNRVRNWLLKCVAGASENLTAVAKPLVICPTSQTEGCSLELWNTHKGLLKKNFTRVVDAVRAQLRSESEPQKRVGGHHSSNDGGADRGGSHRRAIVASSASPTTTSQTANI